MFDIILPELSLVVCAVFAVCAVFLVSNLLARTAARKMSEISNAADLPVVITEEQKQANLAALMSGCSAPASQPVLGSDEWMKRWEAVAAKSNSPAISEISPAAQLEEAVRVDEEKERALRAAEEDEIQRRLDREAKRYQLGQGSPVRVFSKKHGWRSGRIVGFTTRRRARGRVIVELEGRKVRVRRTLDKVEAA